MNNLEGLLGTYVPVAEYPRLVADKNSLDILEPVHAPPPAASRLVLPRKEVQAVVGLGQNVWRRVPKPIAIFEAYTPAIMDRSEQDVCNQRIEGQVSHHAPPLGAFALLHRQSSAGDVCKNATTPSSIR